MKILLSRLWRRELVYIIALIIPFYGLFSNNVASASQSLDDLEVAFGSQNDYCLSCHGIPNLFVEMPSGEPLFLSVNADNFNLSVHGEEDLACVDCHTNIIDFPHPGLESATRREFTFQQNQICQDCHEENYEASLDGVHQKAHDEGNVEAAVCSDCHGAHDTSPPNQPRSKIPQTCRNCHSAIYELYEHSVHGEALIDEGNPDVPSCIDCHGVHNIESASQGSFHLFSPLICANCHTDEALLQKYDLNPVVFDTYVADFHGTTVTLFEQISPDQETNKPVCVDCHGVHDISKTDDPESRVIQQNLLSTCQRCHPNASDNFPSAWLSHYPANWEQTPVVSAVNLFYQIIIPTTVLGMLLFVVPDSLRRIRKKFKRHPDE